MSRKFTLHAVASADLPYAPPAAQQAATNDESY